MKLPAEIRNEIYEYVFLPRSTFGRLQDEELERERLEQEMKDEGSKSTINNDGEITNHDLNDKADVKSESKEPKTDRDNNNKSYIPQPLPPQPAPKLPPQRPSHPLSLLLTCRLAHHEASLLAFRVHPHLISLKDNISYHHLRQLSLRLRGPCFATITSLSFTVYQDSSGHWSTRPHHYQLNEYMCHGILLFRNIAKILVRFVPFVTGKEEFDEDVARGLKERYSRYEEEYERESWRYDELAGARTATCQGHVPDWFVDSLRKMRECSSYRWQSSEQWEETWPFWHFHPNDDVPKEQWCKGDCTVVLVQQKTGRKVAVTLQYAFDPAAAVKPERLRYKVKLVPKTEMQEELVDEVEAVNGETGFMYEPSEDYWDELRKQNARRKGGWMGNLLGSGRGSAK